MSVQVPPGAFVGMYMIQNNTIANWRSTNIDNLASRTTQAFFSFAQGNSDSFDHLRGSFTAGANGTLQLTMNWEDSTGGGDQDFNDGVITTNALPRVNRARRAPSTVTMS